MRKYLVWMWSSTSGGYDHQFYDVYTAENKYEAGKLAEKDSKYGEVHVVSVETYHPGR